MIVLLIVRDQITSKKAGDLTAVLLSQFNEVQLDALEQNLEHKKVPFAEVQWIFIPMVQCQ